MEKHKCKLCFKNFSNGRALGGHMRSHMLNLPIPPRRHEEEEEEQTNQLSDDTESTSSPPSSSPSDEEEDEGELEKGSVILQDRESETESSKNPTRRRSKRTRKLEHQYHHHQQQRQRQEQEMVKKLKFNKLSKTESWPEPEPVSSISDTTTEEDVAFCLMMLSRDKWKRKEQQRHQVQEEDEEEEENAEAEKSMEETDESDEFKSSKQRSRGKYKCETCKKVFKSYQALGGHRASHKKIKFYSPTQEPELDQENAGTSTSVPMLDKKIHECPVCFRVFSSGQALGGHKRTHVTGLVTTTPPTMTSSTPARSSSKLGENLIDLNLPAPIDDDDISQIELSAVSDAEFVNHIKR